MKRSRKNCGPRLVKRIGDLTTQIFEECREKVFSESQLDLFNKDNSFLTIKQLVYDLYLDRLCQLSTRAIEDILWVHNKGKIRRAERTVEALTNELARRHLFDDYKSESNIGEKKTHGKSSR